MRDGVRVLTRTMQQVTMIAGRVGTRVRDRRRSVTRRLLEIMRITRSKGEPRREPLARAYRRLLDATSRVVGQAKQVADEIATGVKRAPDLLTQIALDETPNSRKPSTSSSWSPTNSDRSDRLRKTVGLRPWLTIPKKDVRPADR